MAGVFDFSKLSRLVKKAQLKVIIVIDTNIFINNPDFKTWKTCVNDPVFLLSDSILEEILRLESKPKKYPEEEFEKFRKAHNALDQLLDEGNLTDGVYIEKVGWFVSFDCPSREELQPAIDGLSILSDTHGPNDAIFLLLTKQCSEDFQGRTVVLVTGDRGLKTVGTWRHVPIYYCRTLPDKGFDSWLKQQIAKPLEIDWDKELDAINQKIKEESVEVSLTLTSKRFIRNWPCEIPDPELEGLPKIEARDIIVAEGHGTIHMRDGRVNFLWRLPFKPWASSVLAQDSLRGEPCPLDWNECDEDGVPAMLGLIRKSDLDFLGHDNEVPEVIRQGLLFKLATCESPYPEEGLPTLQSPISLLEAFLRVKLFLDIVKSSEQGVTEAPTPSALNSMDYNGLRDLLSTWLSTHSAEEAAHFVDAVTECWNVGHTIRTRVALDSYSEDKD